MLGAGLAGVDSSYNVGAVVDALLSVVGALATGHSLADDLCVSVDEDLGGGSELLAEFSGEHYMITGPSPDLRGTPNRTGY